MKVPERNDASKFYLVGGGIASLAAAAFLIRDGDIAGRNIQILEGSSLLGGSLDAAGNVENGYTMRGGRMLESKYLCTFDLFSSIPTLDDSTTVAKEIYEWNETMKTHSRSRFFRNGHRVDAPGFGLSESDILTIERMELEPESRLGRSSIADQFDVSFFETDFWLMWCTTFAFQPWHSAIEFKRYLIRFTHMVSGFNTLNGIMRTVYNQYDSLVRPLRKWLELRGVKFMLDTTVIDLGIDDLWGGFEVQRILCQKDAQAVEISVSPCDFVLVTLGSMTDGFSVGSMEKAPAFASQGSGTSWKLWERLARGRIGLGVPANFTDHIDQSQWVSFTTTLYDPYFFDSVRDRTGNAPGEGGLITFPDSAWLASIVLPHQPHFIDQPDDVQVFWGYGIKVTALGDFVKKPMTECSGREIMTEILGHLGLQAETRKVLASCICIPCAMPFITSQFLCRQEGDRPAIIPKDSKNLALIGQFCELPEDVVFTVEYSIRSAQTAVYSLLKLDRTAPPVYRGSHNPRVLLEAFRALHGVHTGD